MIIEKVLQAAKPYLENRKITDAVLGLALIAIELDNGDVGLSYMLRDRLPSGCSSFGFAQEIIGSNAYEVARLALEGKDDAQRGLGMAVLTAGSRQLPIPDDDKRKPHFGVAIESGDTVGMIGFIQPVAEQFAGKVKEVLIFDEGITLSGGEASMTIQPMEKQSELLPECDVVVITGTTLINQSLEELLRWCENAREVILVGSSTPMYPEAFRDTRVSVLAGSWWNNSDKDTLFKRIALAGGISHVSEFMIKKAVTVI